ncbi:MAG: GNAT family N-acetyltransferase [Tepidisphaeraceae bacterium]
MRDAPRKSGDYRREEWIACNVPPPDVDRVARQHTRGTFAICAFTAIGEDDGALRAAFKSLGYRLGATEPLMVHDLRRIPRCDLPATIDRVTTPEMADRVAKVARHRQVLPEHLSDPAEPVREHVAMIDGQIVGRVGSIAAGGAARWCSNMHVLPAFRRRGIGRAMLCRMLRDDRAGGADSAVLTASHTGAKLYATVGYERIATLYLFAPRK